MTNWKVYKIKTAHPNTQGVLFDLGRASEFHVTYRDEDELKSGSVTSFFTYILCADTYPFNTWKEGDCIEIDNDKTRYRSWRDAFDDTSIVRKVSPSTNVITTRGSSSDIVVSSNAVNYMKSPEAMEMAHRMSQMVDETGKNWEYKIEVENKDGKKISHSLICRKD